MPPAPSPDLSDACTCPAGIGPAASGFSGARRSPRRWPPETGGDPRCAENVLPAHPSCAANRSDARDPARPVAAEGCQRLEAGLLTTDFVRFTSSEVALLYEPRGHRAARSDLLAGPRGQAASRSRDHAKEGSSAARCLDNSARPSNRSTPFPSPSLTHTKPAETRSAAPPPRPAIAPSGHPFRRPCTDGRVLAAADSPPDPDSSLERPSAPGNSQSPTPQPANMQKPVAGPSAGSSYSDVRMASADGTGPRNRPAPSTKGSIQRVAQPWLPAGSGCQDPRRRDAPGTVKAGLRRVGTPADVRGFRIVPDDPEANPQAGLRPPPSRAGRLQEWRSYPRSGFRSGC